MIFVSLFWVSDELFKFLINLLFNFWVLIDQKSEQSNEVYESSDSQYRHVLEVFNQVSNMSDYELWQHFHNHWAFEWFSGGSSANETYRLLE